MRKNYTVCDNCGETTTNPFYICFRAVRLYENSRTKAPDEIVIDACSQKCMIAAFTAIIDKMPDEGT